jgi:CHAT domain-containing protein
MIKTNKLLKSIHYYFWLAIFSLFLVLIVLPPITQQASVATETSSKLDTESLILQGKTNYEAGKYSQAVSFWKQACRQYELQGNLLAQALSLSYLSLAHQELGQWQQAEKYINQSLDLLQSVQDSSGKNLSVLAQALNTQGSLQLAMGKTEAAYQSWQQAADAYREAKDEVGLLGSQINQAQALQSLGLYRRSQKLLEQIEQKVDQQSDPSVKVAELRSLGIALQVIGNLNRSQEVLQESLAIAKKLDSPEEISATLFSLGNTARALQHPDDAIAFYQQATATTTQPLTKLEAQLNQLSLLIATQQFSEIEDLLPKIQANLTDLTPSRRVIYARVNLARNLLDLPEKELISSETIATTQDLLKQTIQQAQQLQEPRGYSYALGTLGHFYEQQQQWSSAEEYTKQALQLAQEINAADIAYQWQWQLGRLRKFQGDLSGAIAPYTEAVHALRSIRSDLVAVNPDVQFSFRDTVEPIYRDLVALLLDANPSQDNLIQARETIESLQIAELENFFQEACLQAKPTQIDRVDPTAAVIYPVILPDRLAVILSLPGEPLKYYATNSTQTEVETTLENFLQSFNPAFSEQQNLEFSQQVYDWLIRPAEADLTTHKVKTLVFVLDGFLRNLPMNALYDGQNYLIEKYRVALTPGLQLLEPKPLEPTELTALVAGLSESSQGFAALPGVIQEVAQISEQIPSQLILDREFTDAGFQKQLQKNPVPLIHLATHGQFSSNPEETFILTWNDRIKVKDFENLLRSRDEEQSVPIELMVLSACQTATGDRRAALGMAGIAVRSGARSTLATLWSVSDRSTVMLMNEFYQQLTTGDRFATPSETRIARTDNMTKAEALRQAQLALINSQEFHHPFYWSPFVLVGNWL